MSLAILHKHEVTTMKYYDYGSCTSGGAPQGGQRGNRSLNFQKGGALPPNFHYHVMFTITYSHIMGLFIKNYS